MDDLDIPKFHLEYLPSAIAPDVIEQNHRSDLEQLVALRFCTAESPPRPTNLGVLTVGLDPRRFIPGHYIQFLRLDGTELTDPILDQKEIGGPIPDMLRRLAEVLEINIRTAADVQSQMLEVKRPDYPIVALH